MGMAGIKLSKVHIHSVKPPRFRKRPARVISGTPAARPGGPAGAEHPTGPAGPAAPS
jgi:hypothetical protein